MQNRLHSDRQKGLKLSLHTKNKQLPTPWYLLTNLDNKDEVIKIFSSRGGIEAMFRDCKSGGYNLEGSQANTQRLINLILLIASAL